MMGKLSPGEEAIKMKFGDIIRCKIVDGTFSCDKRAEAGFKWIEIGSGIKKISSTSVDIIKLDLEGTSTIEVSKRSFCTLDDGGKELHCSGY